jgi:hypothetical protein
MMTEDGEEVAKIVDLPVTLLNNAATVEIWYHAYIPKGHLLIDIVPVEAVEDDMPTEEPVETGEDEPPLAAYLLKKTIPGEVSPDSAEEPLAEQEPEVTGFGDSLDYIGKDEPR